MNSILHIEYSILVLRQLLHVQEKEGFKADIYIHKSRPYSFWDVDELKFDIEMAEPLSEKGIKVLSNLLKELREVDSLWDSHFENILPDSTNFDTKKYGKYNLYIELKKSKPEPICFNRIDKERCNDSFTGLMNMIELVSQNTVYEAPVGIVWKRETDQINFDRDSYEYIRLSDIIRKCENIINYLEDILPKDLNKKPFEHTYSKKQIEFIAKRLCTIGKIRSIDDFCDIMNGERNGRIKWFFPKGHVNKSDLKYFVDCFIRKMGKVPNLNTVATIKEMNKIFELPNNDKVGKDGKYMYLETKAFDSIFSELPEQKNTHPF